MFKPTFCRLAASARPSKRTIATSTTTTLSSLISLYHQTPNFAPLTATAMNDYIIHSIIPISSNGSTIKPVPVSSQIREMILSKKGLNAEGGNFDRKGTSVGMDLDSSLTSSNSLFEVSNSDYTYEQGFNKSFSLGSEPPLRRRMRLVMDTLHGTSSGGQAGLLNVLESKIVPLTEQELEIQLERRELERARIEMVEQLQRQEEEIFDQSFTEEDNSDSTRR